MNIKFDELLSEIDNVLQKGEFNLTMSAIRFRIQVFLQSRNTT